MSMEHVLQAEHRANLAEQKLLRYETAAAKGIAFDQIDALTGTTADELEASADWLLAGADAHAEKEPIDPTDLTRGSGYVPMQDGGRWREELTGTPSDELRDVSLDPVELANDVSRW